jgi:hydroxylaminobenzene mutase
MDTLLLQLGILLFLLGFLTGFVIPKLAESPHRAGESPGGGINGIFLVLLGLLWIRFDLSNTWLVITF